MEIQYITSREGLKAVLAEVLSDLNISVNQIPESSIKPPATRQSAAKYLNVSLPTIDKLIESGQLPSFNIGRQIRIKMDDLEAYVRSGGSIKKG